MKKLISLFIACMMLAAILPTAALAGIERATEIPRETKAAAEPAVLWDFETDPAEDGWNFVDEDGDGNNWTWSTAASNSASHSIMSASYSGGALTPDNWAVSPYFDMPEGGATLSFFVKNHSESYPEVFEVYYGYESGTIMTPLATGVSVTGNTWVELTYQIPDFNGERCKIAIRHYGCTDMWRFFIDDVSISDPADPYEITEIAVDGFPTRIFNGQTPAEVLAGLTIPDDAHYMIDTASAYDVEADEEMDGSDEFVEGKSYLFGVMLETELDYSFADDAEILANGGTLELDPGFTSVTNSIAYVVPVEIVCGGEAPIFGCYFETDEELDGWMASDEDGDGYTWGWYCSESVAQYAYEGQGFIGSASYSGGTALTPDNWIVTPMINIPQGTTTLRFYAAGIGTTYAAEHFAVYVTFNEDFAENEMIEVLPEQTTTGNYTEYTVDLSDFGGETIAVSIRHFNCTDMQLLRVDQVEIFNEGAEVEPELIDTIEINGFVEPAWGEAPAYNYTVPDDAHYYIDYTDWNWWDESAADGDTMVDGELFDNTDYVYYAYWQIVADEGYAFADEVTVLINGEEAVAENYDWSETNGYFWIYTIDYEVEPQIGPPISSLDVALNIEGGELHFDSTGDYPWFTVEDEETGRFYAQSGNAGVNSSSSTLTTTVTLEAGSVITFDFKAWGEGSSTFWDHCDFYVNDTRVLYYGAYDNDWETFTYAVDEAGEYTLTWVYTKDSSVSATGDYFAVDNVYVGEPVLPTAINVFDVTVEEGRYTYVVYTIDPEDATDTAVTYEIADTSIATVDENGMIHGVAVGETTITVASASNPEVFGTATVTVTEAGPSVALYGFGCYDISGTNDKKWVTFTDVEPGIVTGLSDVMDNTYAAAYYEGYIYGYRQTDGQFYKVNAETFEVEYLSLAINETALDMAYNYADHTMYLLAQVNESPYPIYLYTVDLETGESTEIAEVTGAEGSVLTLAIDGEGNAYGIATGSNAVLYSVDLATGDCTEIGATGVGMNYIQSMHWDMNTGRLFWAQIYSASDCGLYEVDPETGAATALGVIGTNGMEITGLYTIYDEGTEPPELLGDVDLNGTVEIADAILGMRYVLGLAELTDDQLAQFDVNGDGIYDLRDSILIMRYAMGLITEFPTV